MTPRATLIVGLLVAASLCGSLWIAYSAGHDHGTQACQLAQSKIDTSQRDERDTKMQQAKSVQDQLTDRVAELERELADRKPETELIYKTITKEVIKYAKTPTGSGCVADADFVRLWNAAKDGRDPAGASTGERGNAPAVPDARGNAEARRSDVDDSGGLD